MINIPCTFIVKRGRDSKCHAATVQVSPSRVRLSVSLETEDFLLELKTEGANRVADRIKEILQQPQESADGTWEASLKAYKEREGEENDD